MSTLPVFDPVSAWFLAWETLVFVVTIVNFVMIPFDYSFGSMKQLYLRRITPFVFTVDLLFRFNTSFFEKGYKVSERKKIAGHYLTTQFATDAISTLALAFDFYGFDGTYLLFFARAFYFSSIIDKFMGTIMLNTKLAGTISLLILLAQI